MSSMVGGLISRLREAIKNSMSVSSKHGVIISQKDASQLLYRLLKEEKANGKV